MEEAPKMILCSRHGKGCKVDGPQPIENFQRDPKIKRGYKAYCKSCQADWQKARRARRRAEKSAELEDLFIGISEANRIIMEDMDENEQRQALPPAKETAPAHLLTLDFSRYPNILEMVKKQAEEDIRSPENQILWILKQMEASWRMN